ncbi:MAG: GTPase [Sedimentisphaerales bacterium]
MKADKWFREATTDEEKILALEEMMRVIPKHKGTDHMRAELRKKYSALKESTEKRKKASHGLDFFHIPKSGAGQVVLLGLPNSGKSAIVAAITHAKTHVADFPFTTSLPIPGIAQFEDIKIEIVDMPPITADFAPTGIVNTLRNCDLIGVCIDLSADLEQQIKVCFNFLESRRLMLDPNNSILDESGKSLARKCVIIATKTDIAPAEAVDNLKKYLTRPIDITTISVNDKAALDKMLACFFKLLDIVRIYAKKPGQTPDMKEPFVLPKGSTVMDLAVSIHKELAEKLKAARCWGSGVRDGQNVHRTHILCDKDIIELHFA